MKNIKQRIETFIKDDTHASFLSIEWLLLQLSKIYEAVLKLRSFLYQINFFKSKELPCFVISIGNITAGGTGKTPMTIYIVELIKKMGYKVAVVSRGYKGGFEKKGGIVSDGKTILCKQQEAGDEPFMLASCLKVPVVVGQDRYQAGMTAYKTFLPDVIVLDDAFQHIRLKRNLNIVLLDHSRPFGNNNVLPAGILREGLSALNRGDLFILTRANKIQISKTVEQIKLLRKTIRNNNMKQNKHKQNKIGKRKTENKPVFKSIHKTYINCFIQKTACSPPCLIQDYSKYSLDFLKERKCFIFSGIADNKQFKEGLITFGIKIYDYLEFSDHYRYTDKDLNIIFKRIEYSKVDTILTTEKDFARISKEILWPVDIVVLGVKTDFGNESTALKSYIIRFLKNVKTVAF